MILFDLIRCSSVLRNKIFHYSVKQTGNSAVMLQGGALTFGWAKGRPADREAGNSHAMDCWFCLASPSVKVIK